MLRNWLWQTRWRFGTFLVVSGASRIMPSSPERTDLCRRIMWWSRDWSDRLAKGDELISDVKETTGSWQQETSPVRRRKNSGG